MGLVIPNGIENDTPVDAAEIQENFDAIKIHVNAEVLHRDGSVMMTQPLTLPGDPTQAHHAANKDYVDGRDALYLPLTGGALSGTLAADGGINLPESEPSGIGRAARKDYVDTKLSKSGGTMTGTILLESPQATNDAAPVRYDYAQTHYVQVDGDTMTGELAIGQDADDGQGISLQTTGRVHTHVNTNNTPNITCERTVSVAIDTGEAFVRFVRDGSPIGSITIASSTTVAYNENSAARLKQRVDDVDDAADLAHNLGAKAYRGRWIADQGQGQEWVFLNSVDVAEVAPFAVNGEMVDYSKLVPTLFAALSQALDRIEDLEERLT